MPEARRRLIRDSQRLETARRRILWEFTSISLDFQGFSWIFKDSQRISSLAEAHGGFLPNLSQLELPNPLYFHWISLNSLDFHQFLNRSWDLEPFGMPAATGGDCERMAFKTDNRLRKMIERHHFFNSMHSSTSNPSI